MFLNDDFGSIFDDVFSIFGEPFVVYNANGIQDLHPVHWTKTNDYTYRASVKTLGIKETDIKISYDSNSITVSGESTIYGEKYNTKVRIPVNAEIMKEVNEIKYKTQDGITFVDIIVNVPDKKTIKVSSYNGK
jgi:HSP20 family molecular chaperone IbpA